MIEAPLFGRHRVAIDPRSLERGGSWTPGPGRTAVAYDPEALRFVYERLQAIETPVVLDVGAHHAAFSLLLKDLPGATCCAFEPAPRAFELLRENLRLNALEGRVRAVALALSDKTGSAQLKLPRSPTESGLASLGELSVGGVETLRVATDTLDHAVAELGLARVDFVKIDTEGCELLVLKGGEKTLRRWLPDLFLEYSKTRQFGYEPAQLVALLRSWGYDHAVVSLEDMYFFDPRKRGPLLGLKAGRGLRVLVQRARRKLAALSGRRA